ncbi:hypothetical protein Trydic_g5012 [Trypoxylus dichotomus]
MRDAIKSHEKYMRIPCFAVPIQIRGSFSTGLTFAFIQRARQAALTLAAYKFYPSGGRTLKVKHFDSPSNAVDRIFGE